MAIGVTLPWMPDKMLKIQYSFFCCRFQIYKCWNEYYSFWLARCTVVAIFAFMELDIQIPLITSKTETITYCQKQPC